MDALGFLIQKNEAKSGNSCCRTFGGSSRPTKSERDGYLEPLRHACWQTQHEYPDLRSGTSCLREQQWPSLRRPTEIGALDEVKWKGQDGKGKPDAHAGDRTGGNNPDDVLHCFHCDKKEHWTRDCRTRALAQKAGHAATTTCHGDEFFVEICAKSKTKIEATLRNHFETKRYAIIGLGKDTEGFFLKPTIRWNGHKRCFRWSGDPAQAKRAIQMCECDRAGTKCVATLAVKYAKTT